MYEYKATVIDIHDGDTIHADVDLGCDIHTRLTLRFMGINAPELSTPAGSVSRDWLVNELKDGNLVIRTVKDRREKYGRYLAWLWHQSEGSFINGAFVTLLPSINDRMVASGQAVVYPIK